jgi:mono/diheme cytochrome c family protein
MNKSSKPVFVRVAAGAALLALLVAGVAAGAAGVRVASTPSASVSAGLKLFTSSGCSACHTFRAAAATGKIGPSLDTVKLTQAQIITQVTSGGCAVMTKTACAHYKFSMSSFKSRLSKTQITEVAAFVYTERNKAPLPGTKTTTKSTTTATTTSTPPPTTTAGAPPPTTTAAAPPPTTTATGGGGGGTDTQDNCPAGKTIPTSGNTDGDDDDNGAQSDGDGCI